MRHCHCLSTSACCCLCLCLWAATSSMCSQTRAHAPTATACRQLGGTELLSSSGIDTPHAPLPLPLAVVVSWAAPSSFELGHRHPPCAIATASPPLPVVVSVGATFCSPASWISNAVLSLPRVLPCSARVLLWDEREIAYLYPRVALGVFLGRRVLVLASCAVEAARRRDMLVVPAPRLLRPPTRRPAR